jgi:hypothetical protein
LNWSFVKTINLIWGIVKYRCNGCNYSLCSLGISLCLINKISWILTHCDFNIVWEAFEKIRMGMLWNIDWICFADILPFDYSNMFVGLFIP